MVKLLIRKLEQFTELEDADKRLLADAARDVRDFEAHKDIIAEGTRSDHVHLLIEGWAGRYKVLPNGEHPILAYLIPGDLCDLHITLLDQMDHSIGSLSACKVAFIPRKSMEEILERHGRLSRALWWSSLVDEAILREWLVSVGHRAANKRVAHFICELLLRSKAVGLTHDDSFELPLSQEQLADTMGMTPVHMNRMMQELRREGLISSEGKKICVNGLDRLIEFSDFDPIYLHQSSTHADELTFANRR